MALCKVVRMWVCTNAKCSACSVASSSCAVKGTCLCYVADAQDECKHRFNTVWQFSQMAACLISWRIVTSRNIDCLMQTHLPHGYAMRTLVGIDEWWFIERGWSCWHAGHVRQHAKQHCAKKSSFFQCDVEAFDGVQYGSTLSHSSWEGLNICNEHPSKGHLATVLNQYLLLLMATHRISNIWLSRAGNHLVQTFVMCWWCGFCMLPLYHVNDVTYCA